MKDQVKMVVTTWKVGTKVGTKVGSKMVNLIWHVLCSERLLI